MIEYVFSCRIDGRAGYVRLWSDALELIRSGRRGAGEPEFLWLNAVTRIATGRPGRLFTTVQVVADGVARELTFPAANAPRVAELIEALVGAEGRSSEPSEPSEPSQPVAPPVTMFSRPEPPVVEPDPVPQVWSVEVPSVESERPAGLPEETEERLSRLEVLRSCGIVSEADFAETEAEILEFAWTEVRSA